MSSNTALAEESMRIQASGVLGEAKMRRLFDYLLACSLAEETPKEFTIAVEVFGKGPDFDVSQDALVRVYMHKLRRTLEEFYTVHGSLGVRPLHIPRGEYRLTLNPKAYPAPAEPARSDPPAEQRRAREGPRWWIALAVVMAAGTAIAVSLLMAAGVLRWRTPPTDLDLARANPIWSPLLKDERPLVVVVGDYYLIGETDESMEVKRLIREYSVNSKDDLDNYVQQHPEVADRYMDVGLRYLPTSTAFALRNVMPVLGTGRRHVSLSVMSDLTPAALKSADIVYIGYLSGL